MTKFYFSGLSGKTEAQSLLEAGVRRVLVDPTDLPQAEAFPFVALDSGAYRAFKRGGDIDVDAYLEEVTRRRFDWFVAPDLIGDPVTSRQRWLTHRMDGMVPVWHWDSDEALLYAYLDEAPVVGIGGLVPLMRAKDAAMLAKLTHLCHAHPGRFHLFGANWLKAINDLRETAYSMDTSKFLDAARYGHLIFQHTKTGKLHQAPAKVLGLGELNRFERLVASAKAIDGFCNASL